ncbi:pilin [Patescibacteria group bacterium]|nr:pilin [Patescibacteria group bacterium]MBU1074479.1 pilin [Patescibacteria group bacterium]MBU1951949.1 pilin [Patescibacteria group bacterium]
MKKALCAISGIMFMLWPALTLAVSFYNPSDTLGLGSADLQETIVSIIQWVLGLLGLVAVIMILYAGFIFITAGGGSEERVEKAKKMMTGAIIGLVIILLAWAIVIFTLSVLENTSGVT